MEIDLTKNIKHKDNLIYNENCNCYERKDNRKKFELKSYSFNDLFDKDISKSKSIHIDIRLIEAKNNLEWSICGSDFRKTNLKDNFSGDIYIRGVKSCLDCPILAVRGFGSILHIKATILN